MLLGAAAELLAGLLAGVYAAFVIAMMPGLRLVDDAVFTRAMTAVNRAIRNPAFLALFLGSPATAIALAVVAPAPHVLVAAGAALAALLITFAANIPLNERLQAGGDRRAFERPWTTWHLARTGCAVVAFAALTPAI